jgi:hypothetical protein
MANDPTTVAIYEALLSADPGWALSEGSQFFEGKGAVRQALRKITARLNALGVDYAIAGGMALFQHGLRRFTEDVAILIARDALKEVHRALDGLGYVPPFRGSKNLRDAELGVRIEFLVAGDYPGDGKPKPVRFPDPGPVAVERDGLRYLNLPTLIELKLASGMTNPQRLKDLADVQELIRLLGLPLDYAAQLNEYVRPKYQELWSAGRAGPKRYTTLWHDPRLIAAPASLDEMIALLADAAPQLEAMRAAGVTLDAAGSGPGYAHLVTTDPEVARQYDMHDEAEFLPDGPEETP